MSLGEVCALRFLKLPQVINNTAKFTALATSTRPGFVLESPGRLLFQWGRNWRAQGLSEMQQPRACCPWA
jgi:hypothetical protein